MNRSSSLILGGIVLTALVAGGVLLLNGGSDGRESSAPTDEPMTAEPTDPPTSTVEPTSTAAEAALDEPPASPSDTPTPTATSTATSTPIPARADPATPTPLPTATQEQAAPDPCADHGGVQWAGEVCLCSGVVDVVIICQDGTHSDSVTKRACTAPPGSCGGGADGDGGGSGGGWEPPPQPTEDPE